MEKKITLSFLKVTVRGWDELKQKGKASPFSSSQIEIKTQRETRKKKIY